MAEAEITVREDEDILAEINNDGITERHLPWMRARGSADSVLERDRYPFENPQVFDNCQHCNTPLSGCINGDATSADLPWTLVLTCGHVLCEPCKDECAHTQQDRPNDPALFECPICKEFGSANKLPSHDSLRARTCQSSYCSGESFAPPQHRCEQCQRLLCEGCMEEHAKKFPHHELASRPSSTVSERRAFTGCAMHSAPVIARCDCGEMVCSTCPYNYMSKGHGMKVGQAHHKTPMEEVDLNLEDDLEDTTSTISRIRGMRAIATEKQQELEDVTDRVANEVALHFNQIVMQAVQRCFDVLTRLKEVGGAHHAEIVRHLATLDKTERQLSMGVEMDERARSRDAVRAESVAQYVRNVAYGLCKPAMQQFEDSKAFSAQLESSEFTMEVSAPSTVLILQDIRRWGEHAQSNADDISKPAKEVRIPPSPVVGLNNIMNGGQCASRILENRAPIRSEEIPLRLHTALDHFTDLYERCHAKQPVGMEENGEMPSVLKRALPFQLGERSLSETAGTSEHRESRPGMHINHPKTFGGAPRTLNLRDDRDMTQKEVQAAYSQTPNLGSIWTAHDDDDQATTSQSRAVVHSIGATDEEMTPMTLASMLGRSPEWGAGADESEDALFMRLASAPQSQPSQQQPPAKVPTVLRKKNLVFVKKGELPPVLEPESDLAPPRIPQPQPQRSLPSAFSGSGPSRVLGPSILRRPMPQQPPHSLPSPKMHFRPATNAERASVGGGDAPGGPPPPKKALLLTGPGQMPKRLLIQTPAASKSNPLSEGRTRLVRDANGSTLRFVQQPHSPQQLPSQFRHSGAPSGYRTIASPADRAAADGRTDERRDGSDDSNEEQSPIRINSMRIMGATENRLASMGGAVFRKQAPLQLAIRQESARRTVLQRQGLNDHEIDQVLRRERLSKLRQSNQTIPTPRVFVPRIAPPVDPNRPKFPVASYDESNGAASSQSASKKKMLPIERAFTNLFGADGSIVPEVSAFRRRGRPSKDDPTAPSNIIQEFRKHSTQWPPKFEEMSQAEIADLQDLIDQLDSVTRADEEREEREEGTRPFPLFENGVKSEEEGLVAPWQNWSVEEREQIKAAAQQKIENNANKLPGRGCFVCALLRKHEGRPRTWQCNECYQMGRALTPIGDDEIIEEPQPSKNVPLIVPPLIEDIEEEEPEPEVNEHGGEEIDLSALFPREAPKKVERRGRPKKQKVPEEPVAAPPPAPPAPVPKVVKEPRKRRVVEPVVEEPAQEEEVVMGTTRRGRQIKMPAKLKGHEVHTASTTTTHKRSASVASDASHHSAIAPFNSLPSTFSSTPASTARVSPMKKKIKEEEPDAPMPVPRSAMDGPKRGGRRRH